VNTTYYWNITEVWCYIAITKIFDNSHTGHSSIQTTLSDLAKVAHLRVDDTAFTLTELGFLRHRRPAMAKPEIQKGVGDEDEDIAQMAEGARKLDRDEVGEWQAGEVVITRDMVDEAWLKWGVRDKGVLDETCCIL